MNALVPLRFDNADVRMVLRDGEPWWMLNDVCSVLEIANPRNVAARLRDWQKGVHSMDTLRGPQDATIVNEAGIYRLTLTSRKASAEEFERWLTCEVLPSIRKHGCYPPPPAQALPPPDTETPEDGRSKTVGQRFREERLRWEAEMGYPFAGTVPYFSKPVVRAIEDDLGGIFKGQRIQYLTYAGIDVLYVLQGTRTLTAGERSLRDKYRSADPAQRGKLVAAALALPQAAEGTPPARDT